MRDTQGSGVFAISSACYRRRRIADSWWTLRVRIFYALDNSRQGHEAYEQMAMFYERRARNPEQAWQIVGQVLDELRRAIQVATLLREPIVRSRRGLIIAWSGWNGRARNHSWRAWRCELRLNSEWDGGRTQTGIRNHGEHSGWPSSKHDGRPA